ncbi:MAG TPA: hypothetical protein VEQ63_06870 [Bryobacteraceae bacterium]|nr:hypothetical protein [Bryobacteraceae bacterium]
MTQKSTLIVRGKVTACAAQARASVIFTRCTMSVSERWKGPGGNQVTFNVPGGTANRTTQIFTGTPRFLVGQEYVLFLWAGKSGLNQVIGLSQGVFDVRADSKGPLTVSREATSEKLVDAGGQPVRDQGIEMNLATMRARVERILGGSSR